jgi:transcriptional regulator of acetoin/glycerol metabolism
MEFPKNWEKVYKQWKARKINPTDAAKELGLKRPTFYLMIKRWEVKSPVA